MLTSNQKRFAEYYSQSGNGSEAYKKAYSTCKKDETAKVNASRLLTNANVIEYIEELNKKATNERIADMKEVKEFWTETMRNESIEYKDRIKVSELIGKTNGAFLEKVEHSGEVKTTVDMSNLTVEELRKLAKLSDTNRDR